MTSKKKFMIVDGNAILHRAWHALPPMTRKDGRAVNAVYGFLTTLFKSLKDIGPDFVAVTFDCKQKTFRHLEFTEYKAGRTKQPDELYEQIPMVKEFLTAMNIKIFEKPGFEADDLIGTLCEEKQINRKNILTIIVTGDADALQLVDENTEVYTMRKGMSDIVIYNVASVKERFGGLAPQQLIDYKGLRGDPSDNISGVPGVGEKTAIELLQKFSSIEKLYEAIKKEKKPEIKERILNLLKENEDAAMQSKRLATIIRDVPLDFSFDECELKAYSKEPVIALLHDFEFKSLLPRLPDFSSEKNDKKNVELAEEKKLELPEYSIAVVEEKELPEFLQELKKQKRFAFKVFTNTGTIHDSKLMGLAVSWDGLNSYYLKATKNNLEELKIFLEDEKIEKVGHDLKFDFEVLKLQGIDPKNLFFDTMIASYLLSPGTRSHELKDIVFRLLGVEMVPSTDKKKAGQSTMFAVDNYYELGKQVIFIWKIFEALKTELNENDLMKLFSEIEMPLVEVLAEMELNGVLIDSEYLKELSSQNGKRIKVLTKKIHDLAGEEFNISSPLQLKKILFEKLNISTQGIGKTKTGLSTAAAQLEKLRDAHPIIELIEEYRELTKLQSTYIDALPEMVNKKTGRLHAEFNQTVTATGRLSSSNPNLQNIPIRTEIGREIRKAFVVPKGYKLISSDYSQIELRVIACLAKDENMMDVFKRGEDIHTVTASKIFNVPIEEVTKDMRSASKEVNFGVLYGMGVHGLASRKKISREQAKEFIDKYFENFYKVKEYLEKMKEIAAEKGYVETLFGRKRFLPEINSGVQQIRASAERMAINMPIQGTAADLMKIAMIEVYRELKVKSPKSKLLMQVHDEIVIEVPTADVDKVAKVVDEKMEKIHNLEVPIKVDTEIGNNWEEMERLY